MMDSVRNAESIWVNSSPFREEARRFTESGFYCQEAAESANWYTYWREQRRRCMEGYQSSGARITGDHYFYLNFCQIERVLDTNHRITRKVTGFPDFWDGDYNYFWVREIARNGVAKALLSPEEYAVFQTLPLTDQQMKAIELYKSLHLGVSIMPECLLGGFNLIVGKSRRKGYSYKNAAIASNNFFTKPNSLTILDAYERKFLYPKGAYSMVVDNINFVNLHTAWTMPSDVVNRSNNIRASYITYRDGIKLEMGFKSEVLALTCKDNPDANRGKSAEDVFFEEAGAFGLPGLLKATYAATEDCVRAGTLKTGMITIYGTSGDMEGGTADYADMFSRPSAFGLMAFDNIWDEGMEGTACGFFHPVTWNLEGYYDAQGNSNLVGAKEHEMGKRQELLENGATSIEIQRRMQENPLGPAEAFSMSGNSIFPVPELKAQLMKVKANDWQNLRGTPVELSRDGNGVVAKPILSGANPITSLYDIPVNTKGCPIIYEYPIECAPRGLYKIGYDPVRQDSGTSLAAIIVYKSVMQGSYYHSIIVAEYVGRGEFSDDMDIVAEYLADLYNTTIMYENEVIGTKNYFRRIKRLNLLALQPDAVISKNIHASRVARVYGCHMNAALKDAGERYVRDWLLTVLDHDENGSPVRVIDRIYSQRLLEELIAYRRSGNFDLVSALFMCMFQVQEEYLGKEYSEKKTSNAEKLLRMMGSMYQNRRTLW